VLVLVLTLLSACASVEGPAPVPRPREVSLVGVDPCSLLTAQQRAALGLDRPPVFDSSPSALYNGAEVPLCSIGGVTPRAVSVGVSTVTSAGIELFTSGDLAADIRPLQVRGFAAVIAVPTQFDDYCSVIVDTSPGQLLDVQFADGGRVPPIPQEQLCRDAERVAEAAMGTLLASA
jgi:Protein of unknown function (DUF3558)